MRQLTQTHTYPPKGNCWQTALACILDVDPETMPSQLVWDVKKGLSWAHSYTNVLLGYLDKHHGLHYFELGEYEFPGVFVRNDAYHLLIGPSPRTTEEHPINHCVVAKGGAMVWDPHPSRAGLVEVERWGILTPLPEKLRMQRIGHDAPGSEAWRVFVGCLCPSCVIERGDDLTGLLEM